MPGGPSKAEPGGGRASGAAGAALIKERLNSAAQRDASAESLTWTGLALCFRRCQQKSWIDGPVAFTRPYRRSFGIGFQ